MFFFLYNTIRRNFFLFNYNTAPTPINLLNPSSVVPISLTTRTPVPPDALTQTVRRFNIAYPHQTPIKQHSQQSNATSLQTATLQAYRGGNIPCLPLCFA